MLLTGSFNLSENAEHNAENALGIHDVPLAKDYADYIDSIIELYGPRHFKPSGGNRKKRQRRVPA